MSEPSLPSVRNGGPSKPIKFRDADANARLIAAAPDLLVAAEAAERADEAVLTHGGYEAWLALNDEARRLRQVAIAKATSA